jgi:hypothetical protein
VRLVWQAAEAAYMRRSDDPCDGAAERGGYCAACAGPAATKDDDDDAATAAFATPIMLFVVGWAYRTPRDDENGSCRGGPELTEALELWWCMPELER